MLHKIVDFTIIFLRSYK